MSVVCRTYSYGQIVNPTILETYSLFCSYICHVGSALHRLGVLCLMVDTLAVIDDELDLDLIDAEKNSQRFVFRFGPS